MEKFLWRMKGAGELSLSAGVWGRRSPAAHRDAAAMREGVLGRV